jgi:tetratricopeptide (TPR) repeat protein
LQWIKELANLPTNDPVWSYSVAAMYRILQHPKEALRILKEVEPQPTDNWSFLLLTAETNAELEDFSAALDYFHKVKALHPALIGTDKGFKEMYWGRVLLAEADCHRRVKDYDSAVKCYHDILDQDIGYESHPGEIHANALTSLFAVWNEGSDHAATLSFLRELKDSTKAGQGLSYWLGNIIGSRDTLHGHVIKAAKQLGDVEEISQLYSDVIEPKTPGQVTEGHSPQVPIENIKSLRFFHAALKFHGSHVHRDHVEALKTWEELVSDPDDTWDGYWVVYKTSRVLARALLDKGAGELSDRPGPTSTSSYVARLEALCNSSQQSIRGTRQSVHDPHVCLIRLHLLNGNETLADENARSLLRGVFDEWPSDRNDESLRRRFGVLAQVLTVYGLQDDAVAAWQALKPRGSANTASEDKPGSTAQLIAGDEVGPDHSSATDASSSTLQAQLVRQPPFSPDSRPEAYVSQYLCDSCRQSWTHMLTDCWACRNCLCVQLCTPCHEKLLADDIDPLICNKEHEFVYLPKFDDEKWSSVPDDMILVGGKLVAREQWLNQFREKWDVQQEQIDAYKLETARKLKATFCIAKFVLKCQRKRMNRMKVTRRARTFPLLQAS